ncbi:MAG: TonB family protein [Sulfuriferula sp.]
MSQILSSTASPAYPAPRLASALGLALLLELLFIAVTVWMLARRDVTIPPSSSVPVTVQILQLTKPALVPKPVQAPKPKTETARVSLPKTVMHRALHPRVKPMLAPPVPVTPQPVPLPLSAAPAAAVKLPPPLPEPAVQPPLPLSVQASIAVKENYLATVREAIQTAVQFPADGRLLREEGEVEVQFQLRNGAISNLKILAPGTLDSFNDNALSAVRNATIPQAPKEMKDRLLTLSLWVKFKLKTL